MVKPEHPAEEEALDVLKEEIARREQALSSAGITYNQPELERTVGPRGYNSEVSALFFQDGNEFLECLVYMVYVGGEMEASAEQIRTRFVGDVDRLIREYSDNKRESRDDRSTSLDHGVTSS